MQQSDNDITIPPAPKKADQPAPESQNQNQTQSTGDVGETISKIIDDPRPGLTNNQILYGVGISLVLAVLFWFVGRMLTDTLVKQYAEVGTAKRAGLTLFVFLTVTGIFTAFGFLGGFWNTFAFVLPAALLGALTFFIFLFGLITALRTRRG